MLSLSLKGKNFLEDLRLEEIFILLGLCLRFGNDNFASLRMKAFLVLSGFMCRNFVKFFDGNVLEEIQVGEVPKNRFSSNF